MREYLARLEQVEFSGACERLGAIGDYEFGQEVFDMTFGRIEANDQVIRDLLVGKALCHKLEHFLFTGTQRIRQRLA